MWKSQKVPEFAVPCFDFYGTSRSEKYNILEKKKKKTLVGINSSLDTAEGNISELKNIAI